MSCDCQGLPDFPCIVAGQKQTLVADFGGFLPTGVTLTGTPTVTIALASDNAGTDPTPQDRAIGSPSVVTPINGTAIPNTGIAQQVLMLGGCTYVITWSCTRSDGDVLTRFNHIACISPA